MRLRIRAEAPKVLFGRGNDRSGLVMVLRGWTPRFVGEFPPRNSIVVHDLQK
ncbi:hypothetical protein Enr13x_23780 [Stieleria neptunia]|uniref:Uncharacterized protein n=1 Tax=Stieleria neptunia TaxID=2527979 RepID=A0A518HNV3_9BACT|nr:hypothetical protein Enr13x_23780 [Stieleria neptunia]